MKFPVKAVVFHISVSYHGNVVIIDRWHKERGWSGIGYHYVILNQYPSDISFKKRTPFYSADGDVEVGRDINLNGAHVYGHNTDTIGICFIGKETVSEKQLNSAGELLADFYKKGIISKETEINCHYEYDARKKCPCIDADWFRAIMNVYLPEFMPAGVSSRSVTNKA